MPGKAEPPWLLAPPDTVRGPGTVALDRDEARHAAGSLRLHPGQAVVLVDGSGVVANGVLRRVHGRGCEVEVEVVRQAARGQVPSLALGLATLHTDAMSWAVQKAVELGVERFVPVLTERAQLTAAAVDARLPRWRRLARLALTQCRRPVAMEVAAPVPLAHLVTEAAGEPGTFADLQGVGVAAVPHPALRLLLVGPEGGLSPAELELLRCAGWTGLRLGPFTLRAETACVVGAALLLHRAAGTA